MTPKQAAIAQAKQDLAYLRKSIPACHKRAFDKAMDWKTRYWSYGSTAKTQFAKTAEGKKPLVTGFRKDYREELAAKNGLTIWHDIAFLPENKDIARLAKWVRDSNLPPVDKHKVTGIALGYPLPDVITWSEEHGDTFRWLDPKTDENHIMIDLEELRK